MSTTTTSGWNRPQQNAPKTTPKKPNAMRGIVAGVVTVCALGGLCLWMFSGGEDAPKVKPERKEGRIKAVAPAVTDRVVQVRAKAAANRPVPNADGIIDPGPPPNFKGSVITNANGTVYYSEDPGFAARYHAAMAEQDKLPFKTRAEREIASIIDVEPGQFVLETEFSPALEKDFLEHLEDPIVTKDDDDEHTRQLKQFMRDLKPQLKQAMDRGEKLADLLKDYRRELVKANALKENLSRELTKLQREAKSEDEVKDYINAANKMLDDYGIEHFPVKVSPATLHLIERNNQQENQQ